MNDRQLRFSDLGSSGCPFHDFLEDDDHHCNNCIWSRSGMKL
jgi:hypothetical protein